MKFNPVTISLIIALCLSSALSVFFVDRTKGDWMVTLIGLIGSNSSVLGIIYTLYQLHLIKEEAIIIKTASIEMKKKITEIKHFGDLQRAIKLIQETQGYLRLKKYDFAIDRLQEVKITLTEIQTLEAVKDRKEECDLKIQAINLKIASLEKEIEQRQKTIDIYILNGSLEEITDFLARLKTQISNSI